ncbi:MAG TPA: hypothetical protein VK860_16270 [Ilumatobacteraceae bacterium]|nr:hypothetical protein [Ilumatobacteraceae bacterium]
MPVVDRPVRDDTGRQSPLTDGQPRLGSVIGNRLVRDGDVPFGVDERVIMNSNHTAISTNTIEPQGSAPSGRPPLRHLVGGVVAIGGLTFGIGAALAQETGGRDDPAVNDHPAIAEMARSDGLTGLSPASLSPSPTVPTGYDDNAAIAEWARTHGLTGLSPASLIPTDD